MKILKKVLLYLVILIGITIPFNLIILLCGKLGITADIRCMLEIYYLCGVCYSFLSYLYFKPKKFSKGLLQISAAFIIGSVFTWILSIGTFVSLIWSISVFFGATWEEEFLFENYAVISLISVSAGAALYCGLKSKKESKQEDGKSDK